MAYAKRSKRVVMYDKDKIELVNPETMRLWRMYQKDMTLRELSQGTIANYQSDLFQWFIYILENQDNRSVRELDENDLTDFFFWCKMNGNNTRRMRRRYSSVSAFYKFLRKKRKISENPMEFIDRPIKDNDVVKQTFLTMDQVNLMKRKLAESGNLTLEVYALLSLSTMARVSAIGRLRWEQVNLGERFISDVLEKEGKVVTLYFSEEVREKLIKLKQFRDWNYIDDGGYIFFGKERTGDIKPADPAVLAAWAKKIGKMIGVPTLHPHDFRHSGSQLLKQAGMSLEEIAELLNHESTETTRKHYLQPDKKSIRDAKDRCGL